MTSHRPKRRLTLVPLSLEFLEPRLAPASLISLGDVAVAEGDDGQTTFLNFSVARSGDLNPQVTVSYHTEDGSAHSGVDYSAESGTVVVPAGSTTATISIPIAGNQILQGDRSFRVVLDEVVDVILLPGMPGVSPTFAVQQSFATGGFPAAVAAGDLDGDGKPELVVANTGSNTLSVFHNTTAPGATSVTFASSTIATPRGPKSISIADLNGDGRPDLAFTSYDSYGGVAGANGVVILLNTTAPGSTGPTFTTPRASRPARPSSIPGSSRPATSTATADPTSPSSVGPPAVWRYCSMRPPPGRTSPTSPPTSPSPSARATGRWRSATSTATAGPTSP